MNNVKKSIGWADFSINPVKGLCPVDCKDNQGKSYCYARRMYKRFGWNPEIRFENPPIKMPPEGSKIFVGSTMELFGDWIKPQWMEWLFGAIREHKKHTFIFLTKCPQNLPHEFPDNCWVGVTAVDHTRVIEAHHYLSNIQARVKFLSIEPLLEWHTHSRCEWLEDVLKGLNLIIIGQQTPPSKKTAPKIGWIQEILVACHNAHIPIFMKDNLQPLVDESVGWQGWQLLQEFPNESH